MGESETTLPTRAFSCCLRTSKADSFCQLQLNSNLYKTLNIERQRKPYAKYPVVSGEIRTYTFQGNTDSWEENNIFQDRIPHRMIVGLFDAKAFNQDRDHYPFAFQKFGLETIKEIVRGEEYPYKTLQLNGGNASRDPLGFLRFVLASGERKCSYHVEIHRLGARQELYPIHA